MKWLGLMPYLLCAALGAGVAWPLARSPLQADIADLRAQFAGFRTAQAQAAAEAEQAAAARLLEAQALGDELTSRLASAQARNDQIIKEKAHAIQAATLGRACLSERALRVLDGAPGITVSHGNVGVPAPAGGAAAEDGAVATDTDIGVWITQAGRQYESCRERLDALIDWHATPGSASTSEPAP